MLEFDATLTLGTRIPSPPEGERARVRGSANEETA
jgi:hypothetical protein